MKKIVCREDIQAEMELFEQMRAEIISLKQSVSRLQIQIDELKAGIGYRNIGVPTYREQIYGDPALSQYLSNDFGWTTTSNT